MSGSPGEGVDGLARELAGLPGIVARLLVVHVPDPHGRCRGCTTAGTGVPGAVWPCSLHFYAAAAGQLRPRPGADRAPR